MTLDASRLKEILLSEFNYKPTQADRVVQQLLAMHPDIQAGLETYLQTHVMPDKPVFFGSAPSNLAATYPQKPPAIFLLLDWIRQDRRATYAALQDEYERLPEPLPVNQKQA